MNQNMSTATHHQARTIRTSIPLHWTEANAVSIAVRQVPSRDFTVWQVIEDSGCLSRFDAPSPVLFAHARRIQIEASVDSASTLHQIRRQPREGTDLQMGTTTRG